MGIDVVASGQGCGARVTGLNLSEQLDDATVSAIRAAWLEHHVLAFPNQPMDDDDLERFTRYFGPFGDDPFIAPIEGRDHVIAVRRAADETAPLFAENWHSDWSFQATPPDGTCLRSVVVPPDRWRHPVRQPTCRARSHAPGAPRAHRAPPGGPLRSAGLCADRDVRRR